MAKTRCECKQLSFVGLRSYARRHGITDVDELIRQTGCCTGCGTCRAELEEFLRTGTVEYDGRRFRLPDPDPPQGA